MNSNFLIAPPLVEPVTLGEFKAHAKIDDASDDPLLSALLIGARQWCEVYTRRAFITQSWAATFSDRPVQGYVSLPRAPLLSVSSVSIYDDTDQETVWGVENYFVQSDAQPGRLVLRSGALWPVFDRVAGSMRIEYVAGYGDFASDVPKPLKIAIMQLALHWYEFRGEAIIGGSAAQPPLTVEALLNPYRVVSLGAA